MDFLKHQPYQSLCGDWLFAWVDEDTGIRPHSSQDIRNLGLQVYGCTVPGNFELDLHANGIIDDPFQGMNIVGLRRFEKSHIWYFTSFKADMIEGSSPELVFEGLDCFAEIYLNGVHVGSCDNMLIEHVINVDGALQEDNELLVHIRPAVMEAKKFGYTSNLYALKANYESLFVRKAPHMYGWDIMPRAVSAGLWRPVSLRFRPEERLNEVSLSTMEISSDKSSAALSLFYRASTSGSWGDVHEIAVEASCGASSFSCRERMLFDCGKYRIDVDEPRLWWPRGRGEASLYDVKVSLLKNGRTLDSLVFKHGVRKVNIDTDCRLAITGAIRKVLAESKEKFDPRDYLKPARQAMRQVCADRMISFGQAGQADKIKQITLIDMAARYK